ncbi:uncharacterized protein SPSC_02628 [Sporisorium scitamineum]|uniref:Uncharacterized protein n=1 Tax=Sporisorium scitamineum TaxID=49012 RepID=A0A0F7S3J0_9BASI|nr:hypothetical protein [Sporisorium scitamineum]CDU23999.1 uncharacterized protein SPSC_02628 [Sporisorium scitamineum]
MTSNTPTNRGLAATRKAFTRPANLHLAWSASKGAASPLRRPSSASLTSSQHKSAYRSATPQSSTPAQFHPYVSSVPPTYADYFTASSSKFSTSTTHRYSASGSAASSSSNVVLKSGHLTWRGSGETSGRRGTLGGFERALRRRQGSRDLVTDNDQDVFVALEQSEAHESMHGVLDATAGRPSFSKEPFLASPGAHDPSAFDNDNLLSLQSRSVPFCLSDQSRWVPPPDWNVLDTPLDDHASLSRFSSSSMSDPLQTPRSSLPGSPNAPEIFLNLYSQQSSIRSRSPSRGILQMRLRITRSSTVEMQTCPSFSSSPDSNYIRRKQLVITGEPVDMPLRSQRSQSTATVKWHRDAELASSRPTNVVCILSSADVADLTEWLYAIENTIERCRYSVVERLGRRRTSESIFTSIRLFEQVQAQIDDPRFAEGKDQHSTPMAASRSLPLPVTSGSLPPASAELVSSNFNRSETDFSPSAFINYYAATDAESAVASTSDALYTFEDAYASIMRRYEDYDLPSPLQSLPTAPLDGHVRYARSECLDVPVSPRNYDMEEDPWTPEDDQPSSPLDPWLSHTAARSATSLSASAFGDDTVMQIFAEGFRRRSSSLGGL